MSCSCGMYQGSALHMGLVRNVYEIHTDSMCKKVKFSKRRYRAFHWIVRLGAWLSGDHPGGRVAMEMYENYRAEERRRAQAELRADIEEAFES